MNKLKEIWYNISEMGVKPENGLQLNKRIRILNQSAFLLFIAHSLSGFSDFSINLQFTSYLSIAIGLFLLIVPVLNRAGFYNLSLNSALIIVCTGVFITDSYLGKAASNYIFFFPAIITTAFLTDLENRKLFYFHISIPVGFLILSIYTDHSLFLNTSLSRSQLEMSQAGNITLCSIITIVFVYIIRNINYKVYQSLLLEKNFLDQMFKNSADALLLINFKTGLIEDINAMALSYFEAEKKDLIGISMHSLVKNSQKDENLSFMLKPSKMSNDLNFDVEYKTFNGNSFWGNLALTYFKSGDSLFTIARIVNIDKQKANEEIVNRATKEKEQFLSLIGHEIRTPLNAVIGMSYLLIQDNPSESQREKLGILKFSAEHLLGLLNNVLDFNKIETNKIELEFENVDLRNLLFNIKSLNNQAAENQKSTIELLIDDKLPQFIKADAIRLGQVLNNLVSNAIKFTTNGQITIEISVEELTKMDTKLYFSVKDNGIGIAADKQSQIFEIYKQAESSTTRKYGGSGLGLAITKKLLELMGGNINLVSKPNEGSIFSFSLLFDIGNDPVKELEKENFLILKSKKALIVDDSIFNLMVAKRFLETSGVTVDTAENGLEAIEKVRNNDYDFILMDLQMPELDGYDASKRIRQFNSYTPIIALSAMASSDIDVRLKENGMNDYILKPFDPEVFKNKIIKAIKFSDILESQ